MAYSHTPTSQERRTHRRHNHLAPIIVRASRFHLGGEEDDKRSSTYARMGNFSKTGIYFESDFSFQAGEQIAFKLVDFAPQPYATKIWHECRAIIRWCRRLPATETFSFAIGTEYAHSVDIPLFAITRQAFPSQQQTIGDKAPP